MSEGRLTVRHAFPLSISPARLMCDTLSSDEAYMVFSRSRSLYMRCNNHLYQMTCTIRKRTHGLVLDCWLLSDLQFSIDEVTKGMLFIFLLERYVQNVSIAIIS